MSKNSIIITILTVLVGYFIMIPILNWEVKRRIKYDFDYKSQVKNTVEEMVKPECLSEKK